MTQAPESEEDAAGAASEGPPASDARRDRPATWKRIKRWSGITLLVLLVISVIVSVLNAEALHAVTVRVLDPGAEIRDKTIPGLSKEIALPDYRLDVMRRSEWRVNLGTHQNTSAAQPLRWEIQDPIPVSQITSLRLIDDDKLSNDIIEEVQIESSSFSSKKYEYKLEIARSASAALNYFFFSTPLGMVILGAIGLAIFLFVASYLV